MKKSLFIIMSLFLILISPVKAESDIKVKVYAFMQEDCKECKQIEKWLEKQEDEYIDIEYLTSENNHNILTTLRDKLNFDEENKPLVIIGTNYYIGYNGKVKKEISKAINAYYEKDYCDLISNIVNNGEVNNCAKINEGIASSYKEEKNNVIVIVTSIIFLLGGATVLALSLYKKDLVGIKNAKRTHNRRK